MENYSTYTARQGAHTPKNNAIFEVVVLASSSPYEERKKKMQKWINYFCFESGESINDEKK